MYMSIPNSSIVETQSSIVANSANSIGVNNYILITSATPTVSFGTSKFKTFSSISDLKANFSTTSSPVLFVQTVEDARAKKNLSGFGFSKPTVYLKDADKTLTQCLQEISETVEMAGLEVHFVATDTDFQAAELATAITDFDGYSTTKGSVLEGCTLLVSVEASVDKAALLPNGTQNSILNGSVVVIFVDAPYTNELYNHSAYVIGFMVEGYQKLLSDLNPKNVNSAYIKFDRNATADVINGAFIDAHIKDKGIYYFGFSTAGVARTGYSPLLVEGSFFVSISRRKLQHHIVKSLEKKYIDGVSQNPSAITEQYISSSIIPSMNAFLLDLAKYNIISKNVAQSEVPSTLDIAESELSTLLTYGYLIATKSLPNNQYGIDVFYIVDKIIQKATISITQINQNS